ncbi:M15 family metallopeptidase [Salisediminibacterium selenitireducens]|uniref:Peptidase M15B and M15C DD-carboxypeptidase VanY/endolysin n=1 Tax=Bacillus selenitireducens (strain ATCC 700615 / DSM 15326 / MLS10) TaxID=439292 RepID=D6XVS8_BACIE|nr:M15 family metallopeptidase [Salisediminibacterium selenitireducens]ADH97701.1 peptidase M15B and M15C DD-carboxypeptidase VanY/endolysin [[Bacillus] selenitireducens MLS10]
MRRIYQLTAKLAIALIVSACSNETVERAAEDHGERETYIRDMPQDVLFDDAILETVRITETEGDPPIITDPDHADVLINHDHRLDSSYIPPDLTVPDVRFSFSEALNRRMLREEAAAALESMFQAAEADGISLFAVSGYRSYERQRQIFDTSVQNRGEERTREVIAVPGTSEHQSGLAMDVSSQSNGFRLNTDFADTPEGEWVADHAHEHGYIIRYLEGYEAVTGISFEPWHLRYVGEELAAELFRTGQPLEILMERAERVQEQ